MKNKEQKKKKTMFSDQVQYLTFSCRSVVLCCTVSRIVPAMSWGHCLKLHASIWIVQFPLANYIQSSMDKAWRTVNHLSLSLRQARVGYWFVCNRSLKGARGGLRFPIVTLIYIFFFFKETPNNLIKPLGLYPRRRLCSQNCQSRPLLCRHTPAVPENVRSEFFETVSRDESCDFLSLRSRLVEEVRGRFLVSQVCLHLRF